MKRGLYILIPILVFVLFIFIAYTMLKQDNVEQGLDLQVISGVTFRNDSVTIEFNKSDKMILAFVNTSCGICNEEIEELILYSKSSTVDVVLVSTETYGDLKINLGEDILNDHLHILSISQETAHKFNFTTYPHFKFYRNGVFIKEQLGKINATKYIKTVFG